MEKTYLKLGGQATTYVDQKNVISVSGKEVVEIDSAVALASKSITNALSRGHLVKSDEKEFNDYQKSQEKDQKGSSAGEALAKLKEATPGSGDPSVAAGAAQNDHPDNKANKVGLTGNSGNVEGTNVKNDQTGTTNDEDDDDDDDDDDEALSNSEMIDEIKAAKAPEDVLKGLTKLTPAKLKAAHKKYVTK